MLLCVEARQTAQQHGATRSELALQAPARPRPPEATPTGLTGTGNDSSSIRRARVSAPLSPSLDASSYSSFSSCTSLPRCVLSAKPDRLRRRQSLDALQVSALVPPGYPIVRPMARRRRVRWSLGPWLVALARAQSPTTLRATPTLIAPELSAPPRITTIYITSAAPSIDPSLASVAPVAAESSDRSLTTIALICTSGPCRECRSPLMSQSPSGCCLRPPRLIDGPCCGAGGERRPRWPVL